MTTKQQKAASGMGKGAAKSAVGAFAIAILVEIGIIPVDIGPNTLILLTWAAGQIVYTAVSPNQWADLLGR